MASNPLREPLLSLGKVLTNDRGMPVMVQVDSNTIHFTRSWAFYNKSFRSNPHPGAGGSWRRLDLEYPHPILVVYLAEYWIRKQLSNSQ